jgi:hypothetical protein
MHVAQMILRLLLVLMEILQVVLWKFQRYRSQNKQRIENLCMQILPTLQRALSVLAQPAKGDHDSLTYSCEVLNLL